MRGAPPNQALKLTAAAEVDGVRFDGVDLFLSLPHTDIDSSDDDLARLGYEDVRVLSDEDGDVRGIEARFRKV